MAGQIHPAGTGNRYSRSLGNPWAQYINRYIYNNIYIYYVLLKRTSHHETVIFISLLEMSQKNISPDRYTYSTHWKRGGGRRRYRRGSSQASPSPSCGYSSYANEAGGNWSGSVGRSVCRTRFQRLPTPWRERDNTIWKIFTICATRLNKCFWEFDNWKWFFNVFLRLWAY